MIATIAEPFFEMRARVGMQPVMKLRPEERSKCCNKLKNFFLFLILSLYRLTTTIYRQLNSCCYLSEIDRDTHQEEDEEC